MQDPVVTPEAVALDLEPATVGSRSVAIAIDLALMGTGLLLLTVAEATFGFGGFVPGWFGIALILLLVFSLQFGYPVGFETLWRGRTPGKAALGLRVVTVEGAPVRFRHAAVRAALGLLELTGTAGALAVITSLSSARGQRLGDLAAGTLVIRERQASRAPRAVPFPPPAGYEGYVRVLDTSRLDRRDYATIRDLLRRDLAPDLRQRLAERLAAALVDRLQPPPPAGITAITWLKCVAAAVQRDGRGAGGPAPSTDWGDRRAGTPAAPSTSTGTGGQRATRLADQGGEPGPPPPPRRNEDPADPGGFAPPQ